MSDLSLKDAFPGPLHAPYPGYITSDADRERWDVCAAIALYFSSLYEESGQPDARFVWSVTRSLFNSPTPTGVKELSEADDTDDLLEGLADPPELDLEELRRRIDALQVPTGEDPPGVRWAYVGEVANIFETLFGNPDEFGVIEESVIAYNELLHPRDRFGRWALKLEDVRSQAKRPGFAKRAATVKAALELRRSVRKATKEGGVLKGRIRHGSLTDRQIKAEAKRLSKALRRPRKEIEAKLRATSALADAEEERGRSGIPGLRKDIEREKTAAAAEAIGATSTALTYDPWEEAKKRLRPGLDRAPGESEIDYLQRIGAVVPLGTLGLELDPRNPNETPSLTPEDRPADDSVLFVATAAELVSWAVDHWPSIHAAAIAAGHLVNLVQAAEDDGGADDETLAFVQGLAADHTV